MYLKKILLAVVFLGLLVVGGAAYFIYNALFSPNTSFEKEEVIVYIPTGSTYSEVRGLITPYLKNTTSFEAVARRKKYVDYVKAGRYRISRGMNNNEIINSLRSKNLPVQVSFNNQESLADLAGRISTQIEADSLSLLAAFEDDAFLTEHGFDSNTYLVPYIPNTYEFFWNTSAQGFRDKIFKEYQKFWNEERIKKANDIGLSPVEVISLASIVQKETAKVEERQRVAGVYLNRLKRGMLLQADPTVIYAIKRESGNFDTIIKRVLYRDLELDSPYNTYKSEGIPPGPIAMPDISAVEAVLNPEKHNYYYFVADVENFGYHIFAKNLAQHNRNKAQYVRWINEQNVNR
ncbi:MAG: endolytic transglycosylase MltG [Flavobacteriaceae bacterium]